MKYKFLNSALGVILLLASNLSYAGLIGLEIEGRGELLEAFNTPTIIGEGSEFRGVFDYIQFDFTDDQLIISLYHAGGTVFKLREDYIFSGFGDSINHIEVASNQSVTSETDDFFKPLINDGELTIFMTNYIDFGRDAQIVFNLTSIEQEQIDVPEPSTMAIFIFGMMGLASRRFNKQS